MNILGLQTIGLIRVPWHLTWLQLPCAFGAAEASDSTGGGVQKKNSTTYLSTESGEVQSMIPAPFSPMISESR